MQVIENKELIFAAQYSNSLGDISKFLNNLGVEHKIFDLGLKKSNIFIEYSPRIDNVTHRRVHIKKGVWIVVRYEFIRIGSSYPYEVYKVIETYSEEAFKLKFSQTLTSQYD